MLRFQRDAGNEAGKMPTLPGNSAFHITQFYSHPTATPYEERKLRYPAQFDANLIFPGLYIKEG